MSGWKDLARVGLPKAAVVLHDLFMVWATWYGLHLFRFAIQPQSIAVPMWSTELLLVLAAQGLVFWQVGLYRGIWRFASVPDLVNILKASLLGLLAVVLVLFLYDRLAAPRSVLVL